ncbi:MAG TPA: ABC transporter permease, partial [Rhizobiaceae bacterium]|nr:ABC transporter permease [Rhizobiaceae bacterium]
MLTRLAPAVAIALLAGPVLFGLFGTALPAFGYLPALGGDAFSIDAFRALATQPGLSRSVALSLLTGLASSIIAVAIVALLTAAWSGTRAFTVMRHLISPLLAVPHAAAAFGLAFMIAPSGFLARLFSPWATGWTRPPDWLIVNDPLGLSLVAGLVVKEVPFILLVTLAALPLMRAAETLHVAQGLGHGRIAGFLLTVWPQVYRQIRLAVFAVVAFATSVVDVAAILGPTTPAPLSVRLVEWMADPDLAMRFMASAGALLQLGVTLTALAIWIALERLAAGIARAIASRGMRFSRDAAARNAALGVSLASMAVVAGGLLVLALWSVAGLWQFPDALPTKLVVKTWVDTAPRIVDPLWSTILAASFATIVAVVLAVLCLVRELETGKTGGTRALLFIYLPLLMPQAAFLFGLQFLFLSAGVTPGLVAVSFAHLVFVLPYVFLSLSDPWRAFDRRYE